MIGNARDFYLASGTKPEPVSPAIFKATAHAYGSKRSNGSDHWGARELSALPVEILECFTSLVNDSVSMGIWPIQLFLNLMPVLGKPSGGERCVAKTPVLYRLWCRCTRGLVKSWERQHTASWDTAKEGMSALWPALVRGLRAEVASGTGEAFGASLWDLHKFFDLVDPVTLVKKATALGFPLRILVMGVQMHVAPRALQLLGACSDFISVSRSGLPGCMLAIPFTRVYLREELDRVQLSTPGAEQSVYVDDISQVAQGTFDFVVDALVSGGIKLNEAIARLHLRVSPKSVIVCSAYKLSKSIQAELLQYGIRAQVAKHARDLGVCLNPGSRRSTAGVQAKRLNSARCRLGRTAGLVKVLRGARKLVTTGSFPQALWGHVSQGIAPTVVERFRTQVAAAIGICQSGRRKTTAIALAFGQESDPAVGVVREQVSSGPALE